VNLTYAENRSQLPSEIEPDQVTFVLCIEGTGIERQALLLCASLREFAGKYRGAPILAVSPRAASPICAASAARLAELGVTHIAEPLNETGSPYLPINRIVAGAWAERHGGTRYLAVLDSDMLFVREPAFYGADVGARPVDTKGSTSTGPDDPLDRYWRRICELAEIEPEDLPFVTTSIDKQRVRASYNGGFCIAKRRLGIFQQTADVFFASLRERLRPLEKRGLNVITSVGPVGLVASEFWGSSQAALSAAIASRAEDVLMYDPSYNVPLHLLVAPEGSGADWPARNPVLVHYHWLAEAHRAALMQVLEELEVSGTVRSWLAAQLAGWL